MEDTLNTSTGKHRQQ